MQGIVLFGCQQGREFLSLPEKGERDTGKSIFLLLSSSGTN